MISTEHTCEVTNRMDNKEKAELIAEHFSALARRTEIETAVEYFERYAAFGDESSDPHIKSGEQRTPPMNELYKGISDR